MRCSANATVRMTIILIIKKSNNYFVTGDAAPDGGIVVNTPPGESFEIFTNVFYDCVNAHDLLK